MKLLKPIKRIVVKRTYVISDLIAEKKDRRKHLNLVPEETLQKKLKDAKKEIFSLSEERLDKIIEEEWGTRLEAYNNANWFLAELKTSEIGVWKEAGGLPLPWTDCSIDETAEKVKIALDQKPLPLKKRSRYSIPNILKTNLKLIQVEKYLLPIVFENETGTLGRSGLKRIVKGDIDDGCMRSVALTISGKKIILAYYGIPKTTKAE